MKTRLLLLSTIVLFLTAFTLPAAQGKIELKKGDTAYVCGCGDTCGCEVMSTKEGKCACGHDMTKVTIVAIKKNTATYEAAGKQKELKLNGKYSCACGGDCCQMISKKPGKCVCGKELVKAKDKKKE